MAGLCAAIRLQGAGIPYVVIEKNAEVGGTWYENRYPGAGVDTPNHIYSYSFAKHDWSRYFALQGEIQGYFESVADQHGVRSNIRFNTRVESARYDEAALCWNVRTVGQDGQVQDYVADIVISAVGLLNVPKLPPYPAWRVSRAPASIRRTGRKAWTCAARTWASSATAPAPCRSCPPSPTRSAP